MQGKATRTLLALALAAGCGDGGGKADGGGNGGDDGGATIDAPPGAVDASGPDAAPACEMVAGTPMLTKQLVVNGLQNPVGLVAPPGDPRLFVLEQHTGRILVIKDGALLPTPFLDLSGLSTGNEQGLLGLAFHPRYATNGKFYVNFTDNTGGDTRIVEYKVSADPDVADATSARDLMEVDQPYSNHNAGDLRFGPDGYLYIGQGDGGSGGDPQNRAQNTGTLLGKMLRIDVDSGSPYGVPPTNPYVGAGDPLDEIWAIGLRNPWRYSFDRATGALYIADVGQDEVEEIHVQPPGMGALNYGWRLMEGDRCFIPPNDCNPSGALTLPVHTYTHGAGRCSITGGFVYRGCRMPGHHGKYFYADYCTGEVWSIVVQDGAATNQQSWPSLSGGRISSFGEDSDGELYIVDRQAGAVYKIVPGF